MIYKIAWRNIWRNPLRSSIVLISIILGIWAGVFVISFSYGLNEQRVDEAIHSTLSHVQIHHPEFEQEEQVSYALADITLLKQALDAQPEIEAYSIRTVFNGMVQSASAARGARVLGVNPTQEAMVSNISQKLVDGTWFESKKRNPMVMGQRLAHIMKVHLGSKVVLTFQDVDNNIISARFTIVGLYKSVNSKMDELRVYTNQQDLYPLIGGELNQEAAILVKETPMADAVSVRLAKVLPNLSVKSWKQISPEMAYADEILAISLLLIMGIIMLALMFGIINNMLMAILERTRELGMLQAVGMNRLRIFSMVVIETIFIGLIAGPIGMLSGWATVAYFGKKGLNLSVFGEGLESFGIATRIYTSLDGFYYSSIAAMVFVMALLASIYPAIKALRLNPVEAIRSI